MWLLIEDLNWRARRAMLGLSACSTNWCISTAKSICPSSSSSWIIQIQHYFIIRFYSAVASRDWLFSQLEGFAIILWYHGQRHIYSFSSLQRAELLHAASIHLRTPSLPFPWKKGLPAWVSSKLSVVLPFRKAFFYMGKLSWGGHSRFGLLSHRFFCMLLPSLPEGYYNPIAHHLGLQQWLIYY